MALLKRKAEKTTIISVRVPVSVKEQMETVRTLADQAGFDLTGSLTDAVIKWTKQVQEELSSHPQAHVPNVNKVAASNGAEPESA
jgi:hypothetical protein